MGSLNWHIDDPESWRRAHVIVADTLVRVYPYGGGNQPQIVEMSAGKNPEVWIKTKIASLPADVAATVFVHNPQDRRWEHKPQRWVA